MAKNLLWIFGVVFVAVGVLGFIPNPIVGASAIFETNLVHNLVHLLVGVVLIVVALFAADMAALALKVVGAVYLLVAVLGFVLVPGGGALLGLVQTNVADHWLHVVLGVVILASGFMFGSKSTEAPTA